MTEVLRSSSSSSRRREGITDNQHVAKKVGCMSGILRLHQNHHLSRKRLTSSSKEDKNVISPNKPKSPTKTISATAGDRTTTVPPPETPPSAAELRCLSSNVPRSPTLPAEIRRRDPANSPGSPRRQPALVARLMGLDDLLPTPAPDPAVEKRRELMGALQKCDEDLKALKQIIDAVRSTDDLRVPATAPEKEKESREWMREFVLGRGYRCQAGLGEERGSDGGDSLMEEKRCSDMSAEQPSPVSVLDDICSWPKHSRSHTPQKGHYEFKDDINGSFFRKLMMETLPRFTGRKGGIVSESNQPLTTLRPLSSPSASSKTLIGSVNEVWKDGIWGERLELGRMGIVLEGCIFEELIEETVGTLGVIISLHLPWRPVEKGFAFRPSACVSPVYLFRHR